MYSQAWTCCNNRIKKVAESYQNMNVCVPSTQYGPMVQTVHTAGKFCSVFWTGDTVNWLNWVNCTYYRHNPVQMACFFLITRTLTLSVQHQLPSGPSLADTTWSPPPLAWIIAAFSLHLPQKRGWDNHLHSVCVTSFCNKNKSPVWIGKTLPKNWALFLLLLDCRNGGSTIKFQ